MKLLKISFFAFLFLVFSTTNFAQKKISNGHVTYEITDIKSEMAELAMLKGTEMELYFNDGNQKMAIALMGGLMRIQTILNNNAKNQNTVLMDMMGKKIQLAGLDEEAMKQNPMMSLGNAGENLEYKINKKDKKKIAGYKCRKATAKLPQGMEMNVYVTKKIQPKNSLMQKALGGLEGFPLEFTIDTGAGVAVTFAAQEVEGNFDAATFNIPDGYKKMTLEEFQKEMGGMNLGF
jgi:GLPGLI family protein